MFCPYPFYKIFFVEHGIPWYGMAFRSSWSAVLAVSLPRVLSTPSLWVFEEGIERKVWCCGKTAQQHWCIISSVPATNSEHSTSRAAVRRVNSSPDRPTTAPQRSQAEQRAASASTVSWSGEVCSSELTQLPPLSKLWGVLVPYCDTKDRDCCDLCLRFCRNAPSRQPWTIFPGCVENFSTLERVLRRALCLQCGMYHRIFVSAWAER